MERFVITSDDAALDFTISALYQAIVAVINETTTFFPPNSPPLPCD